MPRIFISYRRADSGFFVGRIYDHLANEFGPDNIFKDVENIPPGKDYREVLSEAVDGCDAMLVVIGPTWATITDDDGNKRLFAEHDFVRFEVERGLSHADALVIPLVVMDAPVPAADALPASIQPLAFRNSLPVRGDPDFSRDMRALIHFLHDMEGTSPSDDSQSFNRRQLDLSDALSADARTPPTPTPEPQTVYVPMSYPGADMLAVRKAMRRRDTNCAIIVGALVCIACIAMLVLANSVDTSTDDAADAPAATMTAGANQFIDVNDPLQDDGTGKQQVAGGSDAVKPVTLTYDSGVVLSLDAPAGWEWLSSANGYMYVGTSSDIVLEVIRVNGLFTLLDKADPFLRLERPGTVVGIAHGVVTDEDALDAVGTAAAYSTYLEDLGYGVAIETLTTSERPGARLTVGVPNYARIFEVYDVRPGEYIYITILSDDLATHIEEVQTMIATVQVN